MQEQKQPNSGTKCGRRDGVWGGSWRGERCRPGGVVANIFKEEKTAFTHWSNNQNDMHKF